MSNERRVRANYAFGVVSVALAVGDTTMSSSGLANLPAIDSYSHAAITINNPATNAYEVIWVTAHTAGATTATISRGMEGSTAQAWPQGTGWVHAPTARDLALAGNPRTIFYDDCDSSIVPDGVILTSAMSSYNPQTRAREFTGNSSYQTPNFTFSGAPGMVELTWSRINAVGTGSFACAIRAAGQSTNLGVYVSHQNDSNDVLYHYGSATGTSSTSFDKTGLLTDRIMFDAGGNAWSGGIQYGARGTLLQASVVVPAGGLLTAGSDYFLIAYGGGTLQWRLHRIAVYA